VIGLHAIRNSMMSKYYWLSSHLFDEGSRIHPGHYGRVVSSYVLGVLQPFGRDAQRLPSALREFVFETIRLQQYPDRPSRLESFFLCETADAATTFLREQGHLRHHEYLYEVEILDADAAIFKADWEDCEIRPGETIRQIIDKAKRYWAGARSDKAEILVTSPIRVAGCLSDTTHRHYAA